VTCGPQKVRSISRGDLLQPMFVVQSAEHLLNSYPTIRRQFVSGMLRAWPSPSSRLWNSRTKTGMRASAIVMHNPFPQNSPQMLFVQRDQPVQARAPHASDQSFTVGIRLRRLHGGSSNFQPEGPQLVINFRGKDRIPIMNQESVGVIARDGFSKLLQGPGCGRMGREIAVQNAATSHLHHHEHVQHSETSRDG
jgi:hypothetical protein